MTRSGLSTLIVWFSLGSVVAAQEEAAKDRPAAPDKQVKALVGEYVAARNRWFAAGRKAKTPEERVAANRLRPKATEFADRFLKIAEDNAGTSAAGDALTWVATNAPRTPQSAKAVAALVKDHLDHPAIAGVCQMMVYDDTPLAEQLFRGVLADNKVAAARGHAAYSLGRYLARKSRSEEAIELLQQVVDDYADLKHRFGGSLGDEAKRDLFELQRLQVGMVAPEIEAEDIDGEFFKLSDYRGRVVLLCFTGNWCAPCRALYPHHQQLVEKHKDKPFTLLAVNSDHDPKIVKASAAKGEITWRSWWDGGGKIPQRGPIAMKWNVNGWPTIYVLDAKGVIRFRRIGGTPLDETAEQLDGIVETLLAELGQGS